MRRLLPLLLLLSTLAAAQRLSAQTALTIAPQHCVWREGDDLDGKLGWAAPDLEELRLNQSAWQPVTSWSGLATPTPRFWLRCLFQPGDLAPAPIVQPVLQVPAILRTRRSPMASGLAARATYSAENIRSA